MWNKINHGGEPTKNVDKKYAIFVGRYQPYHFGHIELIKQKLKEGIPALIMVRNIEPDERNPFTTEQTVSMIRKYAVNYLLFKDDKNGTFLWNLDKLQ